MSCSLTDLTWPTRTARLTIRPVTPADADAVWRIRRIASVDEWRDATRP